MQISEFHIPGMDCPSEEQVIRLKIEGEKGIYLLRFDLEKRLLFVTHDLVDAEVLAMLLPLGFGARLVKSTSTELAETQGDTSGVQRKALVYVLIINAIFFILELFAGLLSRSMGLIADSLDMLADAMVYGLSLYAVGGSLLRKKRIARVSGYFQLSLAIIGFVEVVRRFTGREVMPDYQTMIWVSFFAFLANLTCLWILKKARSEEVHMRASMIFTSNDVIANLGVIAAGLAVFWLGSGFPDLIIGTLVFALVARGAVRILKLSR